MDVKEVHYERVKNLGNYESERCAITIVINSNESPEYAFEVAKKQVNRALGIEVELTESEGFKVEGEVDIFNV